MERPILKPVGTPVAELDTPALVVDMDIMEANIERVHARFRDSAAKIRPYVEAHRCPAIAHKQLAAGGAVGIGVASVGEGEVFAQNGFRDILIANPIASPPKISRLCALANMAKVTIAADNAANIRRLSDAAVSSGVALNVAVDINTGQPRGGVSPGQPALELARAIVQADALTFAGLMCVDVPDFTAAADTLAADARNRIQQTLNTRQLLERHGIAVESVIVGGDSCLEQAADADGVTEALAGAYALMDQAHAALLPQLQPAAAVMASVTSLPEPGTAILDTGRKAMGEDFGFPALADFPNLQVASMSAEHGKLQWTDDAQVSLALGDKIRLIPLEIGGCVNVYDYIHAARDGKLEAVLDITARGKYR